ncbi:P-type conjugative transfer protein TrbJ [Brevundimonas sp. LM2]|uniref:P-type conjugative transfer protein TrbJ n=1 Tax=Brevundimonas sp. LM2 TaxID=1938605 RepID=UPI000983A352|nr:P-type conjugative transfer protein TrbJ [Brevundimonas sp. LM2]AQR61697.1 P-type conjugative transfer protein TrbJ [Brevundimonas sp. LM2]
MSRRPSLPVLALAAGLGLGLAVLPLSETLGRAQAQAVVYDPTNHAQNVLQAARALETVNHQIASLQNEAQMLIGQARNLASLPYSSLDTLRAQVARTQQLLGEAQGLAYDVGRIETAFLQGNYAGPTTATPDRALIERARARWADQVAALQDALKLQAQVVQATGVTGSEMAALIDRSQGAQGALQAAQAGNQLLAVQARQLADLAALTAAQGRSSALAEADRAAERAEARERFARFMGRAGTEP